MEGKDYVVCTADGNPSEYAFKWSLKSDNDTIESVPIILQGRSYLPLEDSVSNARTYVCIVNNTIGLSNPCERHVPGQFSHLDEIYIYILVFYTTFKFYFHLYSYSSLISSFYNYI